MTLPSALFGFLIASLFGSLYHLARGGAGWRILLYLILAWVGFTVGHLLGSLFMWHFLALGTLNTGAATIGSLVFLGLGDWLSRLERSS